jgi:hypothetical protein
MTDSAEWQSTPVRTVAWVSAALHPEPDDPDGVIGAKPVTLVLPQMHAMHRVGASARQEGRRGDVRATISQCR